MLNKITQLFVNRETVWSVYFVRIMALLQIFNVLWIGTLTYLNWGTIADQEFSFIFKLLAIAVFTSIIVMIVTVRDYFITKEQSNESDK